MKFSVITVTFNAGDLLGETINNILSQTYEDFEVVIKDGRSTDTLQPVRRWLRRFSAVCTSLSIPGWSS